MIHEDYKEMLAPQALDALDIADARSFEDHLSGCAECRAELADCRDALAHQRDLVALLGSANAKKMELTGTATAQKARGTFVFDQQTGSAMLMTDALPAAPAGMAYELWFIPKGHLPMAGKVFSVDASGRATVSDLMPPEAREKAVIAITLEPKHGSAQPTGAIYLSSAS